jgi:hypothetical protein
VARAKRTERAEARRRYRAVAATDPSTEELDQEVPAVGPGRVRMPQAARANATPPVRMGFVDAFKGSIRPIHVRADLADLPWLATHTHALWIPLMITVVSTVLVIVTDGETLSQFLFAYFIQTPAIGGVFIAGFLAPRASWLLGVIVGLASAACYSLLVLVFPLTVYASAPPTADQARDVAISAFFLSPVIGGLFASGAAWYRRFLALSNPNRGRRGAAKAAKARPGDGRTRGNASQNAGAKR